MNFLRTPDDRFQNLPDFPHTPHYHDLSDGLRLAYLDEGAADAPPVLLLHGEPDWSFLYRKMIPVYRAAGYRVLAPDLIGFGRSDKPTERASYTYANHLRWLTEWFDALELRGVHLFCQDWGGLLGLRLLTDRTDRFATVVASNTTLPTGDVAPNEAFLAWRKFSQEVPQFPVSDVMQRGSHTTLSPAVLAAYDAPFPDERHKMGARVFPALVPAAPDDPETENNRAAWQQLGQFTKPFLTIFGNQDPIMRGLDKVFQQLVPGAQGQPHARVEGAGHFIQEDRGEEVATLHTEWLSKMN